MPRSQRLLTAGGIYHVCNRFARGEAIFDGGWESGRFLELIEKAKKKDGFAVLAWCMMNNHYHLALRMGPVPLSRSLRSIQGPFSQAFNIRRDRTGPVWQSRFQCRQVFDDDSLQRLILYIHLNPVLAGLVEDPMHYRLCGHPEIMGRSRSTLVDKDDALLAFGQNRQTARRRYVKAMEAALVEKDEDIKLTNTARLSRDAELVPRQDLAGIDLLGRSTGLERPSIGPVDFLRLCAEALEISITDLQGRRRGERLTRARELVATVGLQRWRQGAKALANVLGVHPDSVSRQAVRGENRALEDPDFAGLLDELDRLLASKTAGWIT